MLIVLLIITLLNIGYLFIYIKKMLEFLYKIKEERKEEKAFDDYFKFKALTWVTYALPLLFVVIFVVPRLKLKGWLIIYYLIWGIGALMLELHLKLIAHFLDVIFVREAVKKIEKEYLIGAIKKEGFSYVLKYRLTNEKIII